MKRLLIIVIAGMLATAAHGQQAADPVITVTPSTKSDAAVIADILAVRPAIPVSPYELLRRYEQQMSFISNQLGSELYGVLQAVQSGEIDPDSGDYLSEQRYELAMKRYQLVAVLHANLAKRINNVEQSSVHQEDAADTSCSSPERQPCRHSVVASKQAPAQ